MANQDNIKIFLLENYENHGPKWCADKIGITASACTTLASRLGLSRRSIKRRNIEKFILENYSRMTAGECGAVLNITHQRVRNVACSIGVTGRRKKTVYSKRVNSKFFDQWTEESAYVLGFLYADGNISKDRVTFYQKYEDILLLIRERMEIVNKPRERVNEDNDGFVLSFNNCYMADRLREIGVRPAKSTTGRMVFPDVPDSLFGHFFRGFFDGDGSVGVYGQWDNCRLSLVGPRAWVEEMKSRTDSMLGITGGGVRNASSDNPDFVCCSWGAKRDVKRIWLWMYRGETISLARKKSILDSVFDASVKA